MKDTFSTYHPLLNMLYFVGVIGVTVFVVHPVILAISLFGGIAYSVLLKGWKKTVKFNLIFSIPMMLIVALMNPMFNHYDLIYIEFFPCSIFLYDVHHQVSSYYMLCIYLNFVFSSNNM